MRLCILALIIALLLGLASCTSQEVPPLDPEDKTPGSTGGLSPELSVSTPDPSPSHESYQIGPLIEIDWPEPAEYTPELLVFPLTSQGRIYSTGVSGTVTFVDKDFNNIGLPFQPRAYAAVGWGNIAGYALFLPDDHTERDDGPYGVLMLPDGTVPRGANGKYIALFDYYENSYIVIGSSVLTIQIIHDVPQRTVYSLYDTVTRKETVLGEFDWVEPSNGIIRAYKDEQIYLFNAKGEMIFSYERDEYFVELNEQVVYKYSEHPNAPYHNISRFGEHLYVHADRIIGDYVRIDRSVAFIDKDMRLGEFMPTNENLGFYKNDKFLAVVYSDTVTVFDLKLNAKIYPYPVFDNSESLWIADIDENHIHFRLYTDDGGQQIISTDADGNIKMLNAPPTDELIYWDYQLIGYTWQYNGKTVMSVPSSDGHLWQYGDFVVRTERVGDSMRNDPRAVYAHDGTLLMDNILGLVTPAPNGGMFVYTDPNNCVLLYPNGRTIPVPGAPVVELIYWG